LRLTRPISTQLQKRLRNGHFLHARKELCGRFTRPLTALRAPLRRRGIALPDADSRHEKKICANLARTRAFAADVGANRANRHKPIRKFAAHHRSATPGSGAKSGPHAVDPGSAPPFLD
jgi:hypothetical protein